MVNELPAAFLTWLAQKDPILAEKVEQKAMAEGRAPSRILTDHDVDTYFIYQREFNRQV